MTSKFLNGQEFFAERTDLKYILFDMIFTTILGRLNNTYRDIPVHELVEPLRKEFDGDNAFMAFLFNAMNLYRLQLIQAQNENARLEREFRLLKRKMEEIIRKLKQE